ncbi:DUF5672 family protein [Sphingobium phenoxybenzoativorans]|uniref:DUF5672 family protein n=1 Tax=Sphingobium phenoxybenzoativorans TaxID=1592790 RepID=UPI001112D2FA|nr:DUF5672 family protein [Sphingobium phenoxybenzoativorans]
MTEIPEFLEVIYIPEMKSGSEYSNFIVNYLPDYIDTEFVLVVQWDGFICHPELWTPEFLRYDYIGATWPQFPDGACVGNGGFSLRSKRLLDACRDPEFMFRHPEDVAICRDNRALLEDKYDLRFAPAEIAESFSFERSSPSNPTFGFHGAFNMIEVMGANAFWDTYRTLDDRSSIFVDYGLIAKATFRHGAEMGWIRATWILAKFTVDYVRHKVRKRRAF